MLADLGHRWVGDWRLAIGLVRHLQDCEDDKSVGKPGMDQDNKTSTMRQRMILPVGLKSIIARVTIRIFVVYNDMF